VLELVEQVAAALLVAVRQAVWLRCRVSPEREAPPGVARMLAALAADLAPIEEDRRLDPELRLLLERIRGQAWRLYA
jgi:histidine ammonia-lyase